MIKMIQTSLICPGCGNIFPIMRKRSELREQYHIKTLYCPFCKEITDHIEVRDLDIVLEVIARKEENYKSEEEVKVYSLVRKKG